MTESPEGTKEESSFSEAMEELERILKGIEDERIDIDVLGSELARAAELLELCRGKIRRAETEVTQIVQGLAGEDSDDVGEPPREEGGEEGGDEELPF